MHAKLYWNAYILLMQWSRSSQKNSFANVLTLFFNGYATFFSSKKNEGRDNLKNFKRENKLTFQSKFISRFSNFQMLSIRYCESLGELETLKIMMKFNKCFEAINKIRRLCSCNKNTTLQKRDVQYFQGKVLRLF